MNESGTPGGGCEEMVRRRAVVGGGEKIAVGFVYYESQVFLLS